jgi:hypothetical protein
MIATAVFVTLLASQSAQLTPAQTAFEHFKQLAGDWQGASGDGTKIRHHYSVISAGSVVMEESWFDAHKDEEMVTMYHLNNGKLMLTHYCVAMNQPRLEATRFSDDCNRVEFTFLDATNIKDRNQGHMDRVVCEFIGKDQIKSHWTWFAKGKESWMEDFVLNRVR